MNRRNVKYEVFLTVMTLICVGLWSLCYYLFDPVGESPAMWGFALLCCTFTMSGIHVVHLFLYLEDVT